jgi:SsrA-binding protein
LTVVKRDDILSITMDQNELVRNRRAYHDYEILETHEAGIMLKGTEIKSLRAHGGNLAEAYVKVIDEELWLLGSSIAPYRFGSAFNHEERRDRKLLMHKREIAHLRSQVQLKGFTIVPIAFFLKKGKVKITIGVARGKKNQDKRQSILEREKKREMDRAMKRHA